MHNARARARNNNRYRKRPDFRRPPFTGARRLHVSTLPRAPLVRLGQFSAHSSFPSPSFSTSRSTADFVHLRIFAGSPRIRHGRRCAIEGARMGGEESKLRERELDGKSRAEKSKVPPLPFTAAAVNTARLAGTRATFRARTSCAFPRDSIPRLWTLSAIVV